MLNFEINERLFHFKRPAGTSRGVYTTRKSWFVTITDGERTGVGECAPLPNLSCDDIEDYEKVLRNLCANFSVTGQINYEMLRPYPSMLFGIETALLSLEKGNRLFDTPFSRGEEGIPFNGLIWMGSFDEMRQQVDEKIRQGVRCIKIKIGAIDFNEELELIKYIRQLFSKEELELRVDANGAFGFNEAAEKLEILSHYDIHSIEQPIKSRQWKEMAALCNYSKIPIALDEELIGINIYAMKRQMLEIINPRYIVLKPSLHGGMRGVREWVDIADALGIGSWITSALESNIGLNAVAHLAAEIYGPDITFHQGLGTGMLFHDNIEMPLYVRDSKMFYDMNGGKVF
ncbi:MAG: o-succinylbenzoate synthase [Prevotella sp.]|nr:o-succinylbenzoate synthase [Prevotella sp.]